jgi:hypothetical protein
MTVHMTPPSDEAAHAHQSSDEAAGMAGLVGHSRRRIVHA